jgi:uncharacterized PurR-regulated membrane protein YhhQ (DUF165 family)
VALVAASRLRGFLRNHRETCQIDTIWALWGLLRAYDFRNGAHRAPIAALEDDEGPYRLRHAKDAVWPPKGRAYGGEAPDLRARMARPLRITSRLALPVTLLIVLLGSAYLFTDALLLLPGAPHLVQNAMLAISDLILPIAWFALHLTNRRYGAPYAFGQLVAGFGVIIAVALINPGDIDNWINTTPALSWRAMAAFGVSFLFANVIAITFFDAWRGPRWWTAPLAASFAASLVFSVVYYPAAFAGGQDVAWADSALVHFGVFFAESLLLLVPYYLLRPAMRPLHGMNGY